MSNSQPTKSTNETSNTKSHKTQDKQQKLLRRIIAVSFIVQAALIGARGDRDVLSGKSPLDVVPWIITQDVELILKAQRVEKSLKESDACGKDFVLRQSRRSQF